MPLLPTDKASSQKKLLRRELRQIRGSLDGKYRRSADEKLMDSLFSLPQFKNAKTILTFFPVGSEPSILGIAEKSLAHGKQVAFPLCHPEGPYMTFHAVESLASLTLGSYGISEPAETLPTVSDFTDALCIVPALSFDKSGYRLGYGKGYYDRFLKDFGGVAVGLVYNELLFDDLPRDQYDEKVNIIITEKEVRTV